MYTSQSHLITNYIGYSLLCGAEETCMILTSVTQYSQVSLSTPGCHSALPGVIQYSRMSLSTPGCRSVLPGVTQHSRMSLSTPGCRSVLPGVT